MNWFDVDKAGLAKVIEKRGKQFAIAELVQNVWDLDKATFCEVHLQPIPGTRNYDLIVTDDDPEGFKNLAHAYTLFAESEKKDKAEKRGRFNLGEKLVLAICDEAEIASTTGTVVFDSKGRHNRRVKLAKGSRFRGQFRMTKAEFDEAAVFVKTLIPPPNIRTVFNGMELLSRAPKATFEAALQTEIADAEGYLRKTARKTLIKVYEPFTGEVPSLYEMGIPVVETGDKWHIDISQKVPLNFDRDNVPPAYLRNLRTLVFNEVYKEVKAEDVTKVWVKEAVSSPDARPEAVNHFLTESFGEKRVIFDPSDLEANKLAVASGFTVIAPRSLSADQWANVKSHGLALPAGQVTPSHIAVMKEYFGGKEVDNKKWLPVEKWTPGIGNVVNYSKEVAALLGIPGIDVRILNDAMAPFVACYGNRQLVYNVGRLGYHWFDHGVRPTVNELFIHELAHEYSSDHLSEAYHDALCRLGAAMVQLALTRPQFFVAYEAEGAHV